MNETNSCTDARIFVRSPSPLASSRGTDSTKSSPITFAASTWVAAYQFQPSKTICQPFANIEAIKKNVQPVFVKMLEFGRSTAFSGQKNTDVSESESDAVDRRVVSLTLRAFIKPITFGRKLWVTYEFMKFVKSKGGGGGVVGEGEEAIKEEKE